MSSNCVPTNGRSPPTRRVDTKKEISEHVKNVLRGRAAWGLRHQLQAEWAQLPPTQLHLTKEAAMPRAAGAKRARVGWRAPGEAAPSMGNLG